MKNIQRNILSGLMLILLLAYSLPVSALHHCARFEHSHDELCIEEAHPHCALCELRSESFDEAPLVLPGVPATHDCPPLPSAVSTTAEGFTCIGLNKGPPALG